MHAVCQSAEACIRPIPPARKARSCLVTYSATLIAPVSTFKMLLMPLQPPKLSFLPLPLSPSIVGYTCLFHAHFHHCLSPSTNASQDGAEGATRVDGRQLFDFRRRKVCRPHLTGCVWQKPAFAFLLTLLAALWHTHPMAILCCLRFPSGRRGGTLKCKLEAQGGSTVATPSRNHPPR